MKMNKIKYNKGGLKPIPEGNEGLPNLSKDVRNNMGFMEYGGKSKMMYDEGGKNGEESKPLVTKNPDGGKWVGDEQPPMYGASEDHVPFLTEVYSYMDAGMDMDEVYKTQSHLRPYIDFIHDGQNNKEGSLPNIENGGKPKFIEDVDSMDNSLRQRFGTTKIDKNSDDYRPLYDQFTDEGAGKKAIQNIMKGEGSMEDVGSLTWGTLFRAGELPGKVAKKLRTKPYVPKRKI